VAKSRDTGHLDQVRELILSDEGIMLTDVYMLMGTLRWEREAERTAERERVRAEIARRRKEMELAEAEAQARMATIQRALEVRRAELEVLQVETERQEQAWRECWAALRERRQTTPGMGRNRRTPHQGSDDEKIPC